MAGLKSISQPILPAAILGVGLALFVLGNWKADHRPRAEDLMTVALPIPLQLAYAAGDRYLAANAGTWRAIMVGTQKLPPETLAALARVQEDVSWLNPAHEDNYYTATAILPWEGQVARTQTILHSATEARPEDVYPPFYYGFNQVHFLGDVPGAVEAFRIAAGHAQDEGTRQALTVLAARWSEKSDDTEMAIQMVRVMADATRDRALKDYLQLRIQRLEGLLVLRNAQKQFVQRFGRALASVDELVASGLITKVPQDPLDGGYAVSKDLVVLLPAKR